MKKHLLYLLLIIAAVGCKKDKPQPTGTTPTSTDIKFTLEAKNNSGKFTDDVLRLTMAGDSIVGSVPVMSDEKSFVVSFSPATANVKVGGVVQQSGVTVNDFSKPIVYTYTDAKGVAKNYRMVITNFTGLPIFYITSAGPIVSKDVYVTGNLGINTNGRFDQDQTSIDLQIKGRGNSTWDMPKKPYKMKFNKKTALLGLPAAKNWVLLANYSDKTLLRNSVALDMGHLFSADFTTNYRFVEVVLNGEFEGEYLLTDQVEVNPSRVNIPELGATDNSADAITGGYLLEIDQRLGSAVYFYSNKGLPFNFKSPDPPSADQLNYIQTYIQQTEDAIFANNFADPTNGYAKYINVDSFIDWYLVKELMKDNDGKDFASIYYYKDRGGKLGMGPIWDFDLAAGNTDYSDCKNPTGWWIRDAIWFNRLFQDPAFKAKVKQRWQALQATAIPTVMGNIDKNAAYVNLSQEKNFVRWDILKIYVWPNPVVLGNYPAEVGYMKAWLQQRVTWMDGNL